jgi:hypothetical protein
MKEISEGAPRSFPVIWICPDLRRITRNVRFPEFLAGIICIGLKGRISGSDKLASDPIHNNFFVSQKVRNFRNGSA